jgi:hypothetical protein
MVWVLEMLLGCNLTHARGSFASQLPANEAPTRESHEREPSVEELAGFSNPDHEANGSPARTFSQLPLNHPFHVRVSLLDRSYMINRKGAKPISPSQASPEVL